MSAPSDRLAASRLPGLSPADNTQPAVFGGQQRAFIVLVFALVVMAILPYLVKNLNVTRVTSDSDLLAEVSLTRGLATTAAVALLLVCSLIVLGHGRADRSISAPLILLVALVGPYIISPTLPEIEDLVKVTLGVAVIVTVWSIAAPVDGLKWVPITASVIGIYSIIGGLLFPEYMNRPNSAKALIANWELAGPFWGSNVLGLYCLFSLALTPLVTNVRWRMLNRFVLCATIVASSARTAVIVAGILVLWWIFCRFRSEISIRRAGTVLIGCCAAAVVALPLLTSNQYAFVGRGYAWAESLTLWKESPWVGLGVHFVGPHFKTYSASWTFNHGHNLVIDSLVRSGLVGLGLVVIILLTAVRSTRAFDDDSPHQIALFGYLIAFLAASATEVNWTLLPNRPLFPVVGLIFIVLICREITRPAGAKLAQTIGSGGANPADPRVSKRLP
ncbi:O-antigen ligase [Mycobacterium sp. ACS1612]|uniref:O-antigen ligase family protein n=1 Tax=Mycobacterium sp. ACS1612 TaxID=1834117 RepID=UPI000AD9DD45|nr:O-antigen ligase family protein [Mycobacterium sp. ACS1612]